MCQYQIEETHSNFFLFLMTEKNRAEESEIYNREIWDSEFTRVATINLNLQSYLPRLLLLPPS